MYPFLEQLLLPLLFCSMQSTVTASLENQYCSFVRVTITKRTTEIHYPKGQEAWSLKQECRGTGEVNSSQGLGKLCPRPLSSVPSYTWLFSRPCNTPP